MKVAVMAQIEVVWVLDDCEPSIATEEDKKKLADAIKDDLDADHVTITYLKDFGG